MSAELRPWSISTGVKKVYSDNVNISPFYVGSAVPGAAERAVIDSRELAAGWTAATVSKASAKRARLRTVWSSQRGISVADTPAKDIFPVGFNLRFAKLALWDNPVLTSWGNPLESATSPGTSVMSVTDASTYQKVVHGYASPKLKGIVVGTTINVPLALEYLRALTGDNVVGTPVITSVVSPLTNGTVAEFNACMALAVAGKTVISVKIMDPAGGATGECIYLRYVCDQAAGLLGIKVAIFESYNPAEAGAVQGATFGDFYKIRLKALGASKLWRYHIMSLRDVNVLPAMASQTYDLTFGALGAGGYYPTDFPTIYAQYIPPKPLLFVELDDAQPHTAVLTVNAGDVVAVAGDLTICRHQACVIGGPEFVDDFHLLGAGFDLTAPVGSIRYTGAKVGLTWSGSLIAESGRDKTGLDPADVSALGALKVKSFVRNAGYKAETAAVLKTSLAGYQMAMNVDAAQAAEFLATVVRPADPVKGTPLATVASVCDQVGGKDVSINHQVLDAGSEKIVDIDHIIFRGTYPTVSVSAMKSGVAQGTITSNDVLIAMALNIPMINVVNDGAGGIKPLHDVLATQIVGYAASTPAMLDYVKEMTLQSNEYAVYGENDVADVQALSVGRRAAALLLGNANNRQAMSSVVISALVAAKQVNRSLF